MRAGATVGIDDDLAPGQSAIALRSAYYDEFVFRGNTPNRPGPLWFKVLQQCAGSSLQWTQVPASGISTHGLESPAAVLEVLDIQAGQDHNH